MEIELLYTEDCPWYQTVLKYLEEIVKEKKLDIPVKMLKIKSDDDAVKHRFTGSPTARGNGQDIDFAAQEKEIVSMGCRLYLEGDKISNLPSKEMIRRAIESYIQGTLN